MLHRDGSSINGFQPWGDRQFWLVEVAQNGVIIRPSSAKLEVLRSGKKTICVLQCSSIQLNWNKIKVLKSAENFFLEAYWHWFSVFYRTLFNMLHELFMLVVCVLCGLHENSVSFLEWLCSSEERALHLGAFVYLSVCLFVCPHRTLVFFSGTTCRIEINYDVICHVVWQPCWKSGKTLDLCISKTTWRKKFKLGTWQVLLMGNKCDFYLMMTSVPSLWRHNYICRMLHLISMKNLVGHLGTKWFTEKHLMMSSVTGFGNHIVFLFLTFKNLLWNGWTDRGETLQIYRLSMRNKRFTHMTS